MKWSKLTFAMTVSMGLTALALSSCQSTPKQIQTRDLMSDTWVATDELGREMPTNAQTGGPRTDKTVALFYYLWDMPEHVKQVNDITKLLQDVNPKWGPLYSFHYWGEPYFGYYRMDDKYVIRKHAQMLEDAGVDVIFFDVTNGKTYPESYMPLLEVYQQIRSEGGKTPQIGFLLHSKEKDTAQQLWNDLYSKGLYRDLWFEWKGKPLILADSEQLPPEMQAMFNTRSSWAWSTPNGWFGNGKDKWPWLDNTPQRAGWHDEPSKPEQVPVSTAQHPTSNIGKSFHNGSEPTVPEPTKGLYFAEQWNSALKTDPELIFITQWNEWIAQRFVKEGNTGPKTFIGKPLKEGDSYFVDLYSEEYSRDIEPMRGGYGDNYYYQMIDGIRRFKGVRPMPTPSERKTIEINNHFAQWQNVKPEFLDTLYDTEHRDFPGNGGTHYVNTTGRNDFDLLKVARDQDNLYFYARTREPITSPTGTNWMTLLLDIDQNPHTGWKGYDYMINRVTKDGRVGVVEKNSGSGQWEWSPVGEISFVVKGNEMQLAIPRKLLGLGTDQKLSFDFKWIDHVPESGDIMDFIDKGDVAPDGRFNYRYQE